ncbi:MAG: hypothetical protein V1797_08735 [Pseudomonadota bacterium]
MSQCSFLYQNLIADPGQIRLSSAQPGMVGTPVPRALGTATALSGGEHSGDQDQVFVVEIDSVAAGPAIGQASFRWRRGDASGWEGAGLPTSTALTALADGVGITWQAGAGPDFSLGDAWTILAMRNQGPAMLTDADRDTEWVSQGSAGECLILDAGQAAANPVLAILDHNLSDAAQVSLEPDLVFHPAPAGGSLGAERAWDQAAIDGGFPQTQGRLQLRWTPGVAYTGLPMATNLCTNYNANPTGLTGMGKIGDAAATLTVVDDSAALAEAGLSWLCSSGKVYKLDNSAGTGWVVVTINHRYLALIPHSLSVWMRVTGSGNGASLCWGYDIAPLHTPVTHADYRRVKAENRTPPATAVVTCLRAEAHSVVYFVLNQVEEGGSASHEVVVAGASATSSAYQPLVTQDGRRRSLLYYVADPSHGHLACFDGVNTAQKALDWTAGAAYDIALTWGAAGLSLGVDGGAAATAAFAGSFPLAESLTLLPGSPASQAVDLASLKLYASSSPAAAVQPALTRPHLVQIAQGQTRRWGLILHDPANPEGCLRASLVHLGPAFSPSRTFRSSYQRSLVAGRSTTATDAGKVTGSTRGLAEAWQISFRGLTEADIAGFEAMFAAIHDPGQGRLNPVIFIPFGDDPGRCLYCLPGAQLTPQQRHAQSYELALSLEEVIKSHV